MECTVSWTGASGTRSGMGFVAETGSGHVLAMDGAPDTAHPANGGQNLRDAAYRTLISLDRDHLESQGRWLRLVPGMLVNAEIHLGTRSVFEYLLSPVQKVAHEAGRER